MLYPMYMYRYNMLVVFSHKKLAALFPVVGYDSVDGLGSDPTPTFALPKH